MLEIDPRLGIWEAVLIVGQAMWVPLACVVIAAIVVAVSDKKQN